jgi:hypothetical protein
VACSIKGQFSKIHEFPIREVFWVVIQALL